MTCSQCDHSSLLSLCRHEAVHVVVLQCDDIHKGDNCAGTVGASAVCGPARAREEVHLSFGTEAVICCCCCYLDNAKYFPLEL